VNMMQGELQPASPLRRDQVLAYIIEHIARHGTSPTLAEIGQHLDGISQPRVRELVGQLIKTGGLTKTAGSQRNLRVQRRAERQPTPQRRPAPPEVDGGRSHEADRRPPPA